MKNNTLATHKLYYDNPYIDSCEAIVLDKREYISNNNSNQIIKTEIITDKTCFYPESGGQVCDLGTINDELVEYVYEERDLNGNIKIVHRLSSNISKINVNDRVVCKIDFQKRFQNMQDHSGQHILSYAFYKIANLYTVSMYMGNDFMTIDLLIDDLNKNKVDKNFKLSKLIIDEVEALANQIVQKNLKINSYFIDKNEIKKLNLRKIPELEDEIVRIVSIGDLDIALCCGTHVLQTGEVGLIKILDQQKNKNMVRVVFLTGMKAIKDYRLKNNICYEIANKFSTDVNSIQNVINKLESENKDLIKKKNEYFNMYSQCLANLLIKGEFLENNIFISEFDNIDYNELTYLGQVLAKINGNFSFLLILKNKVDKNFKFVIGKTSNFTLNIKEKFCQIQKQFNINGGGNENLCFGGTINIERLNEFKDISINLLKNKFIGGETCLD